MKKEYIAIWLCSLAYFFPWSIFHFDPFYIHPLSMLSSLFLVIACYLLSRARWSIAVQIIECLCIIYQSNVIVNWDDIGDTYYLYCNDFMLAAFLLELLFIVVSIDKVKVAAHGITNTLRRAFLALVSIYPCEPSGVFELNNKEHFPC